MLDIKAGMPVRSKAGHDKGHCYLVLSEEGRYCYLIDGRARTKERAKKKNKIHLQPAGAQVDISDMNAEDVKAFLKKFFKEDL